MSFNLQQLIDALQLEFIGGADLIINGITTPDGCGQGYRNGDVTGDQEYPRAQGLFVGYAFTEQCAVASRQCTLYKDWTGSRKPLQR